ncbi:MAG TPA: lamin tail domain-containing protein, partial [candidate division Zixibacteria bacterium]|nr:lamin tail domain-containing protein [candidate division Zixibacteria bacterium]
TPLLDIKDQTISNQFFQCYAVRRAYWRGVTEMFDLMAAANVNPYMQKIYDGHSVENIKAYKGARPGFESFDATVMDPAELAEAKNYVAVRRNWIMNNAPFYTGLTTTTFTASGPGSTGSKVFQITGSAPVQARTIKVNGVTIPDVDVTWTSELNYSLDYTATTAGNNALTVTAWNNKGHPVGSAQNFTVNYTGSFTSPSNYLAISEIMYDPADPDGGYIEIYNKHGSETFDLSGMRLNGADFVFPAGSRIGPGQYRVVVASTPAFYRTYSTNAALVLGEYSGTLDNGGETLSLETPVGTNWVVIDAVRYDDDPPWPTEVRGTGYSLQLIDANQDNNRLANWAVGQRWQKVTATGVANSQKIYIYLNGTYGDVLIDDVVLVAGSVANVGSNLIANGDFEGAFPGAWRGDFTCGTVAKVGRDGGHALRVTATPSATGGILQDGIPTVASSTYTLSFWYLPVATGGTFTVRFSNSWISETRNAGKVGAATPGAGNSVAGTLNAIPNLWISEIMPNNTNTPKDNLNESEPWLELYNSDGSATYSLTSGGFYLTADYDNLTAWAFPNSPTLTPSGRRIVWLDGESGETVGTNHLHTSFRANAYTGRVALVQINNSRTTVVDYVNYELIPANKSYGNMPDADSSSRRIFDYPTPAAANNAAAPSNVTIRINEWCADNGNIIADGDGPGGLFQDWIELYNPNPQAVDLSGWKLSDSLTTPDKYTVPAGRSIPANGYLFMWADGEDGQTTPTTLHLNFSLSAGGEYIGLFAPDGRQVDAVTFGPQTEAVSEGRFPDGAGIYPMATPTPGTTNRLLAATTMTRGATNVVVQWNIRPSTQYRLLYTDSLTTTNWLPYGADIQTNAISVQTSLPLNTGRRFFKLIEIR